MLDFFQTLTPSAQLWARLGLAAVLSLLGGLLLRSLLLRSLQVYLRHHPAFLPVTTPGHLRRPLGLFLPLLAFWSSLPLTRLDPATTAGHRLHLVVQVLALLSLGWLLLRLLDVAQDFVQGRFDLDSDDNLSARKVRTQTQFLKRLGSVIVFILIGAAVLTRFDQVREVGTTLLASAGVAGIIIGFAAQKSIANLLAGFQIAFTQPVRIDDVVIVEGEWGRIEEITLTYVVVRIWDKRRLVLPITYFVEKPFQNWTRVSADIVGSVFLYTDFLLPVEELRQELRRLLTANPLWDGEVCVLQVTDIKDRTMEIRALMGARNAGDAWDLRCYVREHLLTYVATHHPHCLPLTRAVLFAEGDGTGPTPHASASIPRSPRPEAGELPEPDR